ncbi:MAG: hypothetical protein ACYC4L_04705 [Chloroflexota bacterium]
MAIAVGPSSQPAGSQLQSGSAKPGSRHWYEKLFQWALVALKGLGWLLLWAVPLSLLLGLANLVHTAVSTDDKPSEAALKVIEKVADWPFVLLVLGFCAGLVYREQIGRLIDRVISLEGPGGWKAQTSQPSNSPAPPTLSPNPADLAPAGGTKTLTAPASVNLVTGEQVKVEEGKTPSVAATTEEDADLLRKALSDRDQAVWYWYFRYLSVFLVPLTQAVLRWFSIWTLPIPEADYHNWFAKSVPDHLQRQIMIDVLLQNGLLHKSDEGFVITDTGRRFLAFIGPTPNLAGVLGVS